MMLQAAAMLCTLLLPAGISNSPGSEDERRARVEGHIIPRPWVEGHAFAILDRMHALNVPGVSIAVISEGRIDWAAGYGVRDSNTMEPVTTRTLFQAASISKPVSAMGTLSLAQDGRLDIDAPVQDLLASWELPAGEFEGHVTPRNLLSHTGGLGVHGFPGYRTFDPLPSVTEVLDGMPPANTGAVRRVEPIESSVRYSGGGSTVMQLALMDLMDMPFDALIKERVLDPLGMEDSTFAQPLPVDAWPDHCAGHGWDGRVIPGRFNVYPEQFPAGLWTTPSDLARFAMDIQRGASGTDGRVLKKEWAQRMLTPVLETSGLGLFLPQYDGDAWFEHGGSNAGFKCKLWASREGGHGVVVMTNGDQGSQIADEIFRAVARVYGWEGIVEEPIASVKLKSTALASYVGRYAFGPDEFVVVSAESEQLIFASPPARPSRLVPLGNHQFLVFGTRNRLTFHGTSDEGAISVSHTARGYAKAQRMDEYERWPMDDLLGGDIELAVEFYREVHAADPTDPMIARDRLVDLTSGFWIAGHLTAGLALAVMTCQLYPEDANAWDALGQLEASSGDTEEALQAFKTCLQLVDKDPLLNDEDRQWLEANVSSLVRGLGK